MQTKFDRSNPKLSIGGLSGPELRKFVHSAEVKSKQDNERVALTTKSLQLHLVHALAHYGRYLSLHTARLDAGGHGLQAVFRIVSMWFKHHTAAHVRIRLLGLYINLG